MKFIKAIIPVVGIAMLTGSASLAFASQGASVVLSAAGLAHAKSYADFSVQSQNLPAGAQIYLGVVGAASAGQVKIQNQTAAGWQTIAVAARPDGSVFGVLPAGTTNANLHIAFSDSTEYLLSAWISDIKGDTLSSVVIPVAVGPIDPNAPAVLGATTNYMFTRVLRVGSRGADVRELQKRLTNEGVYNYAVTGYFGRITQQALKDYQGQNGLNQSGILDDATMVSLNLY